MGKPPYSRFARAYDVFYRSILDYDTLAISAHGMIQARRPGAATLLEAACGTGLYLEKFSKWYDVTGLDASAEMLAVAAQRVPGAALHQLDMSEFDLGARFDAVACLFSSIGYVVTRDRLRSAIRCFSAHLNPGGVLLLEPWLGPDAWIDHHVTAEAAAEGGTAVARTTTAIRDGNRVTMRWGFSVAGPDGDTETYIEDHATGLFTHEEYAEALESAGIAFDYDPAGLLGRGRYVGVKTVVV